MGASSSCCFCIPKAEESPCAENGGVAKLEMVGAESEESPCTENGGVAKLEMVGAESEESPCTEIGGGAKLEMVGAQGEEAPCTENDGSSKLEMVEAEGEEAPCTENDGGSNLEMVGAEGASTSGRTEYYSERCEVMKRSRSKFSDDVAFQIEFSKSHWSEVSRLEVAPQSAQEEELNRENRELFKQLREEYPDLFYNDLDGFGLGGMIAKGGQAEIFEVVGQPDKLMKVFERGTSLRDLRRSWPLPVLNEDVRHCIFYAGMLKDGRFAFLMYRCWGDLRKLIDQAMQEKNVDGIQSPPFPYNGWKEANGWNLHPVDFMLGIAKHMLNLHEKVTGRIPFDDELRNTRADRQLVIEGKRPQLPSDLDDAVKDLITKCWAPNPSWRPTFSEIVNMLETISTRQCQFRLFGIDDELPLQYRLATVQEVGEYPIALMKVMPRWQIANLANGSVDGREYGMNTRLMEQSNAGRKLARLHH